MLPVLRRPSTITDRSLLLLTRRERLLTCEDQMWWQNRDLFSVVHGVVSKLLSR